MQQAKQQIAAPVHAARRKFLEAKKHLWKLISNTSDVSAMLAMLNALEGMEEQAHEYARVRELHAKNA
jgi:hypothetical protein